MTIVELRVNCASFSPSNSFRSGTTTGNSQGFPVPIVAKPPMPNDVNWSKPPATKSMAYLRIRASLTAAVSFSSCRSKSAFLTLVQGWIKLFSIFFRRSVGIKSSRSSSLESASLTIESSSSEEFSSEPLMSECLLFDEFLRLLFFSDVPEFF